MLCSRKGEEEGATWEVKCGFIVSGKIERAYSLDWRKGKCIR